MAIAKSRRGERVSGQSVRQLPFRPTISAMPPPPPPMEIPRPREAQLSLKDMIEMTAQRENLPYYPQVDRFYDNKQVGSFFFFFFVIL